MLKKLFLSHYSGDAEEVREFAAALRLRGIVPWVDKSGGFSVADDSEVEARRAIREDCFGLVLWATGKAFESDFIRDVEMDEARKQVNAGSPFLLFAIPHTISFRSLKELSEARFGIDLSRFHTVPITTGSRLHPTTEKIARLIMAARLKVVSVPASDEGLSLQICTRESLPPQPRDLLAVDACELFSRGAGQPEGWNQLLSGLRDIKSELAAVFGRPRIHVNGSKHLSAAFLAGRVFSPFELSMQQTSNEIWFSDALAASDDQPFTVVCEDIRSAGNLVVEIASGRKNIKSGVDAMANSPATGAAIRLSLVASEPINVDNARCAAMARQAYEEIELAASRAAISQIHLFAAAPGSFMAFLGRHFRGMPETVTYEWEEGQYVKAATIPGSVL
jgi:hypothetical protein